MIRSAFAVVGLLVILLVARAAHADTYSQAEKQYKFAAQELSVAVGNTNLWSWPGSHPTNVHQYCDAWRYIIYVYQQNQDGMYRVYRDLTMGEAFGVSFGSKFPVESYCKNF